MAHFAVVPTALVLGLPAAAFFVASLAKRHKQPKSSVPRTAEDLISQGALTAVHRARSRFDIVLDYTPESIRKIETMLARVREVYLTDPRMVDIESMAFVLGAYVGETMRKNNPGVAWQHMGVGDMYALSYSGESCFPVQWCLDRMTQGESENVWTKYRLFLHQTVEVAAPAPRLKSLSASAGRL